MITSDEVRKLIQKYEAGKATETEKARLEAWYIQWNQETLPPSEREVEAAKKKVWQQLEPKKENVKNLFRYLPYAAAVFLIASIGYWFFFQQKQGGASKTQPELQADIQPGGNKAMLTLADGTTIDLSKLNAGEIAKQSGIRITKSENNELVYHTDANLSVEGELYNTISTPLGGQFQVVLPDGSKVWLNAGSSLRYPIRFAKQNRRVELRGEAYFEVKKNSKPFLVLSGEQQVEVLGTHFNVNAYQDEPTILTTLLEGSVRVSLSKQASSISAILKPGQQSVFQTGHIAVRNVDTKAYVGWKNNLIVFESQDLGNIMRQVARWYNVDVVFEEPDLAKKKFSGSISKYESVDQVLDILALTGLVDFKIEERRIIVMK